MTYFNRKTEYALLSMEHMLQRNYQETSVVTNTREIADAYKIPYSLLAKVLQRLAAKGLVKSVPGTNGGYLLTKRPEDISIIQVVEAFEGSVALADCFKSEKITCPQWDDCTIKSPLYHLNHKIYHLLAQTTLADLMKKDSHLMTHPKEVALKNYPA